MKIKTQYNPQTSLVCGYFPENKDYSLVFAIDEENKTIDDLPYVEIEEKDQVLDKEMCVVDGVYQEYIKPLNLQIEEAKQEKLRELKSKRDEKLTKSIFTVSVDGVDCAFYLRTADLPRIKSKIEDLSNNTDTKTWGDVNGKRINLNKAFFETLKNDINANDETIWDLYGEKLEELEALAQEESTTLEDIKNFNTNLI
jgi:hypothetical protein